MRRQPRVYAGRARVLERGGHRSEDRFAACPGDQTLDALLAAGGAGTFDFAFVDADKSNYGAHLRALPRARSSGGLIAFDNVLWGGQVADKRYRDADTQSLRALNLQVRNDDRVDAALVTIGDGFLLARKR